MTDCVLATRELLHSHVAVVLVVEAAVLFLHVREAGVVIGVDVRQVHLRHRTTLSEV